MSNINLLPWREELKEQKKREFFIALGLCCFSVVLLMGLVHLAIASRIDAQATNNAYLKKEIQALDAKIAKIDGLQKEKNRLLSRMEIIGELQANRPLIVKLFDGLVKTVPNGLYLVELNRSGDLVTMAGKAESNSRVSKFMRNIESSSWLKAPILSLIKADEKDKTGIGANGFNLQALQVTQSLQNKEEK